MVDAMSKALDELMGKHRNVAEPEAQQRKMHFDDEEVCKHELAGLCPYTLFNNTKSDLGSCGFDVHSGHREFERLQREYDALSDAEKEDRGYERVLYDLLARLTHKMDQTIAKNKETIIRDNQPRPIKAVDQARLDAMKQQEQESIERSEALAMEGDADGSIAMAEKASKFKEEHDKLREELVTPDRIKSVCEVCGVFVNSTDNEQRREEHFNGKQFVGWSKIRAKLKHLEEKFRGSGARERTERDGDRDRDRNWQRATSRDREREGRGASRGHDDYRGGDSRGYGGGERERDRRGDRYGERGYGGGGERYGDRGYRGERGYEDRRGGYGGSRERERGSDRYGERGGYGDRGGYGSSGRREYRR